MVVKGRRRARCQPRRHFSGILSHGMWVPLREILKNLPIDPCSVAFSNFQHARKDEPGGAAYHFDGPSPFEALLKASGTVGGRHTFCFFGPDPWMHRSPLSLSLFPPTFITGLGIPYTSIDLWYIICHTKYYFASLSHHQKMKLLVMVIINIIYIYIYLT